MTSQDRGFKRFAFATGTADDDDDDDDDDDFLGSRVSRPRRERWAVAEWRRAPLATDHGHSGPASKLTAPVRRPTRRTPDAAGPDDHHHHHHPAPDTHYSQHAFVLFQDLAARRAALELRQAAHQEKKAALRDYKRSAEAVLMVLPQLNFNSL